MKKLLCIILIFITMLSTGCVEKKVKPSNVRKYLVYNLGALPSDLLMLNSDDVRQEDLLLALFEGLVREDKNGEIVPAMAETIDISEDKIGYTFKLSKNLHYSDGTDIKALDFVRFFHSIFIILNIIGILLLLFTVLIPTQMFGTNIWEHTIA